MICKKIAIENYRNIEKEQLELDDNINIIHGDNAQGKTNILESLYLFANGKSFRANSDRDLIRFECGQAVLNIDFCDERRMQSQRICLNRGRGRGYMRNGVVIKSVSDFIGHFRAVLFSPEHIGIVRDGPALRRAFLDSALCQLKPLYLRSLQRYNIILQQRNALLKRLNEKGGLGDDTLGIWSSQLAREAAYIAAERDNYVNMLENQVAEFFSGLICCDEKISMRYDRVMSEDEYLKKLTGNVKREIEVQSTLYGIHKDDIDIGINGRDSRLYASQGQMRCISFAIKIGEGLISERITSSTPVYLLDDVLSELDKNRRNYVLTCLTGKQVIITTCADEELLGIDAKRIRVSGGKVTT